MKQKRLPDTGAEAIAASVASVERTRDLCPFAGEPGTPALGETLCGAWVGVRWGGRRPGAIRHLRTRRWPGNRVSASGRGNRSEWLHAVVVAPVLVRIEMLRKGRTYELLITQHRPGSASDGRRLRWRRRFCFVEFMGGWNWTCQAKDKEPSRRRIADVLFARRRRSDHPKTISRGDRAITKAVNCVGCSHSSFFQTV